MSPIVNDGLTMMERMQQTGSFLPRGVAYAISSWHNGLQMVTYADLLLARKERQAAHLKLVLDSPRTRWAGFIWTFWTPGLGGFAYRGWWAYLRTIEGNEPLNFRGLNHHVIQQAMDMFPCGVLPIEENLHQWMEAFGTEHHRPGRFKKQGLAPVWIERINGVSVLSQSAAAPSSPAPTSTDPAAPSGT